VGSGCPAAPKADPPLANIITQIVLNPSTPNILANNQNVTLDFTYKTNNPGGVRIIARPMTGGALTPNYASSDSALLPTGTGSASQSFTITSGDVTVDQVHFEITNPNQTLLLQELFVPVHYEFTSAADRITSFSFSPVTPNILLTNQNVTINFSYAASHTGGVRIFASPMTGGSPSPNYAASSSPLYSGTGTGNATFTITVGGATVDQILVQITNANETLLLEEFFIPVYFQFTSATNAVRQFSFAAANPNILEFDAHVTLNFTYDTNHVGGVRILVRPFTQGAPSPDFSASVSPVYAPLSGFASQFVTIVGTNTTVDQIRIQIYNVDQTVLLQEFFLPVNYQYNLGSLLPGGGGLKFIFLPLVHK
jgi:hypothetical protein